MEETKNVKKSKFKKMIIPLLILIICIVIFILSFDKIPETFALIFKEVIVKLSPILFKISLDTLNYDILISDFKVRNPEIEGGFATIKHAVLVNSEKKEMYTIKYQDVWDIHEKRGHIDSVSIEIEKLSNDEISKIKKENSTQEISKIKEFLNTYIKSNYKIDIEK